MDTALLVLACVLLLAGFAGAVLPIVPGPPLSWVGVLLVHASGYAAFSTTTLVLSAVVMALVTVLDYVIPVWGTKRFGGSRSGVIGATVGLVAGLFFIPFGIVVGPFAGALVGELVHAPGEFGRALRSASGSFVGFLVATWLKLMYGSWAISAVLWALIF